MRRLVGSSTLPAMPATKVYLSTVRAAVDPEDAKISVFDRGFLYGDSVYETLRTAGGRPLEFPRHYERLVRSGLGIGLVLPFSQAEVLAAIAEAHRAAENDESYVRVVVTRGAGPIALDPRKSEVPTLVVIVQPLALPDAVTYERGVHVVVVDVVKGGGGLVDPGIKTGNYLANILALRQAIERGGDDAILCNAQGEVAEGATSNLFLVQDGALVTPHLQAGLLAGITRQAVCELATAAGFPPHERRVAVDELRAADELFLTSSVRGIMPVTQLDGAPVGEGRVGPVTLRLREQYERYLQRWASGTDPS